MILYDMPFEPHAGCEESLNPIADMKTELEGRHGRETNIAEEDLEMHEKQMEQKRGEDLGTSSYIEICF